MGLRIMFSNQQTAQDQPPLLFILHCLHFPGPSHPCCSPQTLSETGPAGLSSAIPISSLAPSIYTMCMERWMWISHIRWAATPHSTQLLSVPVPKACSTEHWFYSRFHGIEFCGQIHLTILMGNDLNVVYHPSVTMRDLFHDTPPLPPVWTSKSKDLKSLI